MRNRLFQTSNVNANEISGLQCTSLPTPFVSTNADISPLIFWILLQIPRIELRLPAYVFWREEQGP